MLILSLDSAGESCGACVWQDGKVLALIEERMERGQDQRLMPLVLDVMKQAAITFNQLDRIAITRGPGSFTGLRIGLAAARGMGLAAEKPILGIDRFSIYYEVFRKENKNIFVLINSKRKELFCKYYTVNGSANEAVMLTPEEISDFMKDKENILITGDQDIAGIESFQIFPHKEVVLCAQLASTAPINDSQYLPRPLYLRAPDVTVKKK